LKSKRKKRVIVSNEPLEVHDSDSDDRPAADQPRRGTPSQAAVVDSPSPIKKKRAPKKTAAAKVFKSNEFILDEVDDDDHEPPAKRRVEEPPEEDENMYDQSFINDGSSDVHAMSPQAKQSGKSAGKAKEKAKTKEAISSRRTDRPW
jgi:hypothetical protein